MTITITDKEEVGRRTRVSLISPDSWLPGGDGGALPVNVVITRVPYKVVVRVVLQVNTVERWAESQQLEYFFLRWRRRPRT